MIIPSRLEREYNKSLRYVDSDYMDLNKIHIRWGLAVVFEIDINLETIITLLHFD